MQQHRMHVPPQATRALKIADLLSPLIDDSDSLEQVSQGTSSGTITIPRMPDGRSRLSTAQSIVRQTFVEQQQQPLRAHAQAHPTRRDWETFLQRTVAEGQRAPVCEPLPRRPHSRSVSRSLDDGFSQATHEQHSETDYDSAVSPVLPASSPILATPMLYEYALSFRQQPTAARACGHGDRDRRVIDPPPILELKITHKDGTPAMDANALFAMHCSLKDAVTGRSTSTDSDPRGGSMMGASAASPFHGKDEFHHAGTFFVFSDLSCRSTGRFRLNFTLLRIDTTKLQPGAKHLMVASIDSDIFTSYTAKDFPGMQASTPLLIKLKDQGLNVGIKKGSSSRIFKRRARSFSAEDDDFSAADDRETAFADSAAVSPTTAVRQKVANATGRRTKKFRAERVIDARD